MASSDPLVVERQMYYDLLGITTSSLSLAELRDLTGGGVNARRAASAAGISEEGLPGTILTDNITDSTAVGRAVLKAVDQAAGRTAIDAAASDHTHHINDIEATGVKDGSTFLRSDSTWALPPDSGGGGVTDHGDLDGLADDDHPQYHNNARGDARYEPLKGVDDNFVTDAEKAALHGHGNLAALNLVSGTNTGDQTLPTWSTIAGKPAVVAAGATEADARAAIGAAPSLGVDDNYVTDAEKAALHTHPAIIAQGATEADARAAISAAVEPTGTPDGTKFYRDDGTWAVPAGGSDPWTYVIATVDTTNNTTTQTNATGLTITGLADGLYEIEARIIGAAASSNGVRVGLATPASAPANAMIWGLGTSGSAQLFRAVGSDERSPNVAATGNNRNSPATTQSTFIVGTVRATSMTGSIDITVASEVAAVDATVKADSYIKYRRISA